MLAIIGNLHMTELLVIALAALMIFGRRLPEVAMRGAAQVVRLRRSVTKMWREAGLEEELRKVRRDIDNEVDKVQRSLPSLTGPEDDLEDAVGEDPQHEHWRADIHSELPEDEDGEQDEYHDPLARERLDGEPSEEAIRQEGEVDDPPQESVSYEDEPAEPVASIESGTVDGADAPDDSMESGTVDGPDESIESDTVDGADGFESSDSESSETGTKESA
jgi:Sec-independent protein translocase protein TatA